MRTGVVVHLSPTDRNLWPWQRGGLHRMSPRDWRTSAARLLHTARSSSGSRVAGQRNATAWRWPWGASRSRPWPCRPDG